MTAASTAAVSGIDVVPVQRLARPAGSGWVLAEPADDAATISPAEAVDAARSEVHGGAIDAAHTVFVALADFTNNPTGRTDVSPPAPPREAWVVEIDGVRLPHSVPRAGDTDNTAVGTVQWVIDASTGAYVMARDFSPGPSAS